MKTNCPKIISQILIVCLLCNVVETLAVERYVNVNNTTPGAPYLTWATAATTIQAAINAASDGDVITVTNGVYQTGGTELIQDTGTSRVSISKALLVQSVNGPVVTIINGGGTIRCVALVRNAMLSGFTLTNGFPGGLYAHGGGALGSHIVQNRIGTLTNCILTGNRTGFKGGGAYGCTLNNCILKNNVCGQGVSIGSSGGGADSCNLNNCLVTGNTSSSSNVGLGGGAGSSTLNNCTVSNNFASYRGGGTESSIVNDCIIVNNVAGAFGGGSADLAMTNCFIAGNLVTNLTGGSGGGAAASGFLTTAKIPLVNCVFVNNRVTGTNGTGGGVAGQHHRFSNCAFTNNSASVGGAVYGGELYDCILVGNQATNGAGLGGGAAGDASAGARLERCLLLGNSAKNGGGVGGNVGTEECVFGGNSASVAGGGVYSGGHGLAVITNNFALDGGGASWASCYTCQFSGNMATNRGGAVYGSGALSYCTIAGNSAGSEGGGICGTTDDFPFVNYSIIYHNSAPFYPNCDPSSAVGDSCTTPMPTSGSNNFTDEPAFVNLAAGDYRLSSNSPCINYLYWPSPPDPQFPDLDGNAKPIGGSIDLGAYEFQSPSSTISYLWLQHHGFPTDGSADNADPDGDSFDNHSEWVAHTDPFDEASLVRFHSISVVTDPEEPTWQLIRLEWQSMPGVAYIIEIANDGTGPFVHLDTVSADSTNTGWEIALPIEPASSLFFKLGIH